MAAQTAVFVKKIPFSNAQPGGRITEIWSLPAGTAADTAAITCQNIVALEAVIGGMVDTPAPSGAGRVG